MLPLNKAEKPLSEKRRVPPAHGGHRQEVSRHRQRPSRLRRRAREKHREEWIFFYCFQQGIISLFVMVHMVWVLFVPESGTFENPVEEPLTVVQELSVETHLLAWIWMVIVAAPHWNKVQPRDSRLTPCLAGALRICLHPSHSALYSWLPNASLVVCWLYRPLPWRLLDSLWGCLVSLF
jgi:hypothetical protein